MRMTATAGTSYGGGTARAARSAVPTPSAASRGGVEYGAEVKRAKQIALGLFIALVLVHATKD